MNRSLAYCLLCAAALISGAAVWRAIFSGQPEVAISESAASPAPDRQKSPTVSVEIPVETGPAVPHSAGPSALSTFDPHRLLAEIATTADPAAQQATERLLAAGTTLEKGLAADELARLGSFDAVANLLRVAGLQESAEDRAAILDGLANLHGAEGFQTLASLIGATRDPQFLDAAVANLARSDAPEVLGSLTELYRERNDAVFQKNQALRAIAALRHPGMARRLAKLAGQAEEPALAEAAGAAWQNIRRVESAE